MWGSGRCSTHHTKLVGKVSVKKVSEVDRHGHVTWPMREVCSYACPSKLDKQSSSDNLAENLVPAKSVEANGNKKIFLMRTIGPITHSSSGGKEYNWL